MSDMHTQASLSPERLAIERGRAERVFGQERMQEAAAEPASLSKAADFAFLVEHLCTGPGSNVHRGAQTIRLPIDEKLHKQTKLSWNPTGAWQGGFGDTGEWDRALARLWDFDSSKNIEHKRWGRDVFHAVHEGLMVDYHGQAYVHATHNQYGEAYKPATHSEVMKGIGMVASLSQLAPKGPRPLFVEVGFGLDPAPMRGDRSFANKRYLGVDPGIGSYESTLGEYPRAFQVSLAEFIAEAATAPHLEVEFVQGDGQNLDVPDGSAREVFLSNVLNASEIPIQTVHDIVAEAERALEPRGMLVARANWDTHLWGPGMIAELLSMHRLNAVAILKDPQDMPFVYLDTLYGQPQTVEPPDGGYYVVAESGKPPVFEV